MAGIVSVLNETRSSSSRYTREGKKITYSLDVIQQPKRARACGSGAKSSADRRPVDPPPIVVLRVFEGEALNEITFSYNANFFLFATLENARTMAQARSQPSQTNPPVLTGTPVAGMSYLDRPSPAGYFIFPDLSVRHEGKYRLSFTLYEQLKDSKDADGDDHITVEVPHINAHVSHRLEVKSTPFTVYSAKKFPGLAESTTLSTTVAEQGCRVRIRKDIRMRRRETKPSREWDSYEDETAHERARRTATPDGYGQQHVHNMATMDHEGRSRSVSLASNGNATPVNLQQRRPSIHDLPQTYQNEYPAPQTPQQPCYPQHVPHNNGMHYSYHNHYAVQQPSPAQQQQHQQQQQAAPLSSPHHHYSQYQHQQYQHQHQHQQQQYQHQQQQAQPQFQSVMQPPQTHYLPNTQPYHSQPPVPQQQPYSFPQSPQNAQNCRAPPLGVEYISPSGERGGQVQQAQNGLQIPALSKETVNAGHAFNYPSIYSRHPSTQNLSSVATQAPSMLPHNVTHGPGSGQPTLLQSHQIKIEPMCTMSSYQPVAASSGAQEHNEGHQMQIVKESEGLSVFQNVNLGIKRRPGSDYENGRLRNRERPNETRTENGNYYQLSDEELEHPDRVAMSYRRANGTMVKRVVPRLG